MLMYSQYNRQWFNKASSQEKQAADQQQAFAQTLKDTYSSQLGTANSSLDFLNNRLQNVFTQAQSGFGFSPAELAALKTNNIEGQANATQQANVAAARQIAQRGNGGGTDSGTLAQITAQNARASAVAGQQANNQIDIANAQQAQQNVTQAGSLLNGVAGTQAGVASSALSGAVNQGGTAFNNVAQAYKPSNFWGNLGQGLLSGAISAGAGVLTGGASTLLSGIGSAASGTAGFMSKYGQSVTGG